MVTRAGDGASLDVERGFYAEPKGATEVREYLLPWSAGGPPAIVRVEPANGNRTMISDETTGSGPNDGMRWIAMDAERKRVIGGSDGFVLSIDVRTGERRLLSEGFVIEDVHASAMALDADDDRVLLASASLRSSWSPASARCWAGRASARDRMVRGLTTVPRRQLALVLCRGSLIVVDLTTGERVIISLRHPVGRCGTWCPGCFTVVPTCATVTGPAREIPRDP
jgi:hypothetical protein